MDTAAKCSQVDIHSWAVVIYLEFIRLKLKQTNKYRIYSDFVPFKQTNVFPRFKEKNNLPADYKLKLGMSQFLNQFYYPNGQPRLKLKPKEEREIWAKSSSQVSLRREIPTLIVSDESLKIYIPENQIPSPPEDDSSLSLGKNLSPENSETTGTSWDSSLRSKFFDHWN